MKSVALFSLVALAVTAIACANKDETVPPATPAQTGAYPAQQGQYPAQQGQYPAPQGQYPAQQGQYPAPQGQYPAQQAPAPGYPQTPATPATPAAAGGTMATPGPLALMCQNDQACGFARCNVQFQKCAFPCLTQVDCAQGAGCNTMTGLCIPGAK